VLASSLAGQPGMVSELTRPFHEEFKVLGLPPGFFDAAGVTSMPAVSMSAWLL
jgi:hypothetical protein